jgi:arabinan endo-1,5-alpha-L-arabinosidase
LYKSPSSEFYFFFFSDGITPLEGVCNIRLLYQCKIIEECDSKQATQRPAPGAEYKVLVGRSTNATGPFVDKNGKTLTDNVTPQPGSLVLGSHDNVYAPGGTSQSFCSLDCAFYETKFGHRPEPIPRSRWRTRHHGVSLCEE